MFTRHATLITAMSFLLFSSLAQAKAAPALEVPSQARDAILQQLINQPQGANSCELSDLRAPAVTAQIAVNIVLERDRNDLCPIPAPPADPFGNVASL